MDNYVLCSICKRSVQIESCWCVIDTRTKERGYECKDPCHPPPSAPPLESVREEARPVEALEIGDWTPSYPSQSILTRVLNLFSTPAGYTKVKMQ